MMGGPLYYCRECSARRTKLETDFIADIAEGRACAKHPDAPAHHLCRECGLPLCPKCAYFTVRGSFHARPDRGPYCLTCFRTATPREDWRRWAGPNGAVHVRPLTARLRQMQSLGQGILLVLGLLVGVALLGDAFRRYRAAFYVAWPAVLAGAFLHRRSAFATAVTPHAARQVRSLLVGFAVVLGICTFADYGRVRDALGERYVRGYYVTLDEDYDAETGRPYAATIVHADRWRDRAALSLFEWAWLAACIAVPWAVWRCSSAVCAMAYRRQQTQPQHTADPP